MENNAYCNQSIMCSVTNCKHHNSTKDYCSLEAIKVGTHEQSRSELTRQIRLFVSARTARALKQSAAASNLI